MCMVVDVRVPPVVDVHVVGTTTDVKTLDATGSTWQVGTHKDVGPLDGEGVGCTSEGTSLTGIGR